VTAPDCPNPSTCPVPDPVSFDLRRLRTVRPSLTSFYTAYRAKYWPGVFNPGYGDTRFAPLHAAGGSPVPTLYGGVTKTVALLESVFHEVHVVGARLISRAIDLAPRGLVELSPAAPLSFVDLSDAALVGLGIVRPDGKAAREQLVATGPAHYRCTRLWGEHLHAVGEINGDLPMGIRWQSRIAELAASGAPLLEDLFNLDNTSVFVLFGDRMGTDIDDYTIGEHYQDLDADDAGGLVVAIAEQLGAVIV
jgi:hypothetical protein